MKKSSNIFKFLTLVALSLVIKTVSAQTYRYLGEAENSRYYITSDKASMKLGRGVVAWIVSETENMDFAYKYFISCDGKYMSNDSFGVAISTKETKIERRIEISQSIKTSKNTDTGYILIEDIDSVDLVVKNKIKNAVKDVCAGASQERKGLLLPFFQSVYNKDGVASVRSLMSGTISRKSDLVEGWIRGHQVIRQEMRKSNGEVFINNQGKPMMYDRLKDESYTMIRFAVNCKEEKYAVLMETEYDNFGTPKPNSFNTSKPTFQSAVPNTEGEFTIQAFCRVY